MKLKNEITLTGLQLKEAIDLVDHDLETEITITKMEAWKDYETGEMQPPGYYVSYEEYPEFGLYGPLGMDETNE